MDESIQDLQPCHPIAIERGHLNALQAILEEDESTPLFDGPMADTMRQEFDEAMEEATGTSTTERFEKQRGKIRKLLEHWEGDLDGDIGSVLVTLGAERELDLFWARIQERIQPEDDPLTISENTFDQIVELHRKVRSAEDDQPLVLASEDDVALPVKNPAE